MYNDHELDSELTSEPNNLEALEAQLELATEQSNYERIYNKPKPHWKEARIDTRYLTTDHPNLPNTNTEEIDKIANSITNSIIPNPNKQELPNDNKIHLNLDNKPENLEETTQNITNEIIDN